MPQAVATRQTERNLADRFSRHHELSRLLDQGSAQGVRVFVIEVSNFFTDLGTRAGLSPDGAAVIAGMVVQTAFPSLLCIRRGHLQAASRLLVATWRVYRGESVPQPAQLAAHCRPTPQDDELLRLFSTTVSGVLVTQAATTRGRAILTRLAEALRLSHDDVGRILGVSGETVRRWAHGKIAVPEGALAQLDAAEAALTRLLTLFRPERLPEVIRRPAEMFGGERALDWIQRGRIADVADRYDLALAYQA